MSTNGDTTAAVMLATLDRIEAARSPSCTAAELLRGWHLYEHEDGERDLGGEG